MNKNAFTNDWPLAVFTLALQTACGFSIAATIVAYSDGILGADAFVPFGISVFPTISGALLVSMLHVGRPLHVWRALANIRQSKLSREVMLTVLFLICGFGCSWSWWAGEPTFLVSAIAAISGVAAVIASASIYQIQTKPAWNSGWVPLSFLGSTLAIGAIPMLVLSRAATAGVVLGLLGSGLLVIAAAWMKTNSALRCREQNSVPFLTTLHFVGTLLLPCLLLVNIAAAHKQATLVLVCLITVAVLTGRILIFRIGSLDARF